jgi:hypothetical protein
MPHQQSQFNVLCQPGEDQEDHAKKPVVFETPIRGRPFQSPSPMPQQQSQFNVLCRSILASRKVLAYPDMAGRCEGRVCYI